MSLNPLNGARALLHRVAFALRESGQALERVGCRLQGIYSYEEPLSRHMPVKPLRYDTPSIGKDSFVAASGLVSGKATLGERCTVWYGASIRGEHQPVTIGDNTNIQDGAVVGGLSEHAPPTRIGNNVSIGHGAILKGCTIGDNVLIGINAIISDNVTVEPGSIVAAGAYVEEDTVIPSGEVWAGNPAKKLRALKPQEKDYTKNLPPRYVELGAQHQEIANLLKLKMSEYSGNTGHH